MTVSNSGDQPVTSLVGAFSLRWTPPPGWGTPPLDFKPTIEWRPNGYWPDAPDYWEFWRIDGDDEIVEQFHGPLTADPQAPSPVWTPPAGWPQPPLGWSPPPGWTPDRAWGPAPPHWKFWSQPDADERGLAAARLTLRSDRLFQLNRIERLMRLFSDHLQILESLEFRRRLGALPSLSARRRARRGVDESTALASEALNGTRETLMWLLLHDMPPTDAAIEWLMRVEPCMKDSQRWVREVHGLRPSESVEEQTLRLLNSYPYGAGVPREAAMAARAAFVGEVTVEVPEIMWQRAEELAAASLRHFGYPDARITASGADGGIDVRAAGVVAQVKYTSRAVGRPVLQQLVGAADGVPCACFALEGYTQQAIDYAGERNIALFTLTLPDRVVPVNARAQQLAMP